MKIVTRFRKVEICIDDAHIDDRVYASYGKRTERHLPSPSTLLRRSAHLRKRYIFPFRIMEKS